MDNLISKNYQQMISVPGSQNNELNKFFETIDNLNKPFKFNESKFGLDVRDENGNSILHRIIINSLNEQELLNKIQFIPNIETLINTINFKQQTPLHLLCKYQYYESYLLLKKTLEGSEIDYLKEEENIIRYLKKDDTLTITKNKSKGIGIKYDVLDYKNRLPLSYLVVGVDIDKIKCKCSDEAMKAINDFKNIDKNKLNINKMKQYFYECNFAVETPDADGNITGRKINDNDITLVAAVAPALPVTGKVPNDLIYNITISDDNKVESNEFIHNLILNNKFVHRYINKNFFTDIINETEKVNKLIVLDERINVDGMYGLNYFINKTAGALVPYDIHDIKSSDYYCAFSVYMINKIIGKLNYDDTKYDYYKYEIDNTKYSDLTNKFICTDIDKCKDSDKINKDTYKQEVIKQYEEIIETKTSLINKVFMDNQKYTPAVPAF